MRYLHPRLILALTAVLGVSLLFWPARSGRSDNFVFYQTNAHQLLPFEVIEHTKYLPLLQVLNLVGKVNALQEKGTSVVVWFGSTPLELHVDDKGVRINKVLVNLADPVRISNGQWMVPVDFLTALLPKLTHEPVKYQVGTNRVFIGDVKPASFSVRLDQVANGARLTVQFSDKVTVRTVARDGVWEMSLGERPVQPLEQTYRFQDPFVRELRFDDHEGVPKLILTPTGDGFNFYPVLAEGGKVLLADVVKPPPAVVEPPRPAEPPPKTAAASAPSQPTVIEEVPVTQPGPPLPAVVLDAGHGGPDTGAHSRDGILEKDLVAQLVGRVRLALLTTKNYRIVLTRVGDSSPTFEQREVAANTAGPVAFLTFHAGSFGTNAPRIAVYTYQASSSLLGSKPEDSKGLLIPWTRLQLTQLDRSRQLAQALQQFFGQVPGVIADKPAEAPVRALRSVGAPSVAIEVGSLSPEADSAALTNPNLQQQISTAIVQALESFQGRQS